MIKNILVLLPVFWGLMFLTGCSSGGGEEIPNPTPKPTPTPSEPEPGITISSDIITNGLTFSNSEGSQSISFTTNVDWALTIDGGSGWCTPSATSGSSGTVSVTFKVSANDKTDDRKATITITAGTASKTFSIFQEKLYVMKVHTDSINVEFSGETIELKMETNAEYKTTISCDWIKQKEGLMFEVAPNETNEVRKAEITFSNEEKNLKQTVVITQDAKPGITISSDIITNGLTFSNSEGSQSISFTTNVDWALTIDGGSGWCTPSATSGSSGTVSVTFKVSANDKTDDRKATITITAGTASKTFSIFQEKLYVMKVHTDSINVEFSGETIELKMETNAEYKTTISCDWIKQKEGLMFEVAPNETNEVRKAEITFSNEEKNLKQTVVITQDAKPEDNTQDPTGNIENMTWG